MSRPIRATIHVAHLSHNLGVAKQLAHGANVFAVVKANAYGHGIDVVPLAFADADGLALIEIENAVRLREMGWGKPLMLLEGCYDEADWRAAAEYRLSTVIHCDEQLSQFESLALPRRIDVFLKFNTGMNRLGFRIERLRGLAQRVLAHAGVGSVTLMTHFACADDPEGYAEQLHRFNEHSAGVPLPKSVANSAACFDFAKANGAMGSTGDWVRPGIMLYGATPFTHATKSAASLGLKPGMSLTTEIIGIQELRAGESVGYGASYTATKHERIAVIAAGYADGYPRHAQTGTPVVVDGMRTRIVGRVSMDKITVDVTNLPDTHVGGAVELFGSQLAVDEVANAAGTIGYELLTAISRRARLDHA
ncbi:MAG: alanine racemase [Casimicrobium sp.]